MVFLVELIHGRLNAVGIGILKCVGSAAYGAFDEGLFFGSKTPEHMVVEGASVWLANANTQAGDGFSGKVDEDGFETVLTAGTTGFAEAQGAEREGGVVKNNEHLVGRKFEVADKIPYGISAEVHECLRFHKRSATTNGGISVPFRVKAEFDCRAAGEFIHDEESDVVPGTRMLAPGIAQANDETKDRCIFHAQEGLLFLPGGRGICLLFLDDLRSRGRSGGADRLFGDLGLGHVDNDQIPVIDGGHALRKNEVADVDGVADFEWRDVDADDFRKILRETLDGNRAHVLLEKSAEVFDSIGFTEWFDHDFGFDLFGHGNSVEIDVKNFAADDVVLHFLNEGERIGLFAIGFDFEFNQDVLANGMVEESLDLATGNFEIGGLGGATVNDSGNAAAGADLFDRVAAALGAGTCGEFNLLGHR